VALAHADLLPVNVPDEVQPCTTMGVHPALPVVQQLYSEGDVAFLVNVGTLVEPLSKAEYLSKAKELPPSLFAHNVQQKVTQSMHPQDTVASGVLGRLVDVLGRDSGDAAAYKTGSYSLNGVVKMLEGERSPIVLDKSGVVAFEQQADLGAVLANLTLTSGGGSAGTKYRSVFAETWARQLNGALTSSQTLSAATADISTSATFPSTDLGEQLEQVARVIGARSALDEERQVFFVKHPGYDSHASLKDKVHEKFQSMNAALEAFETEMKAQGVWDEVVLLTSSDFGRTYGSNGAGTDHAWGGNYLLMGGAVNGGQLFGAFPSSFFEAGDVVLSRSGRILPTTPWEAVWYGLAEWFGVDLSSMSEVLPNVDRFPLDSMLRANAVDGRPGLTKA